MEKRGQITDETPLSEHDRGEDPGAKKASDSRFEQDLARRAAKAADERLAGKKS